MTEMEQEFLNIYRSLTDEGKRKVILYVYELNAPEAIEIPEKLKYPAAHEPQHTYK